MKHIFIMNPAAGSGSGYKTYKEKIAAVCSAKNVDYIIHSSTAVGEATQFVTGFAEHHPGEDLRFYAAGGDGTVCEVAAGCVNRPNCSLAIIPVGTGNDFVRNFTNSENFLDLEKQFESHAEKIDVISYCDRYFINMFNVGFDCAVVSKASEIKRKPYMIPGMAYTAGIVVTLAKKPTVKAKITLGNGECFEEELLLMTVANGRFYGGGFKPSPESKINDGIIDVMLVKNISRRAFISMVGDYKKGTHVEKPYRDTLMTFRSTDSLKIEFSDEIPVCIDGELEMRNSVSMKVLPKAINLSLPYGCEIVGEKSKVSV